MEDGETHKEKRPEFGDGLEVERQKRIRKGKAEYLIKCLKTKKSSSKRKQNVVASKPKKGQRTQSLAAASPSGDHLANKTSHVSSFVKDSLMVEEENLVSDRVVEAGDENDLHMKIIELKVSTATKCCPIRSQVPTQDDLANDSFLSNRCIGAKKRKSDPVVRFISQASPSTVDGAEDESTQEVLCEMATEQGAMGDNSNTSKTQDNNNPIIEILNAVPTVNNSGEVLVIFNAKRADGTESIVNNGDLKATHPDLLINFYEQYLWYTQHMI